MCQLEDPGPKNRHRLFAQPIPRPSLSYYKPNTLAYQSAKAQNTSNCIQKSSRLASCKLPKTSVACVSDFLLLAASWSSRHVGIALEREHHRCEMRVSPSQGPWS